MDDTAKRPLNRSDVLYRLGIVKLWSWLTRKNLRIFTIHGVINGAESEWSPLRWQLEENVLRQHLKILVEHFEFLEADEALDMLEGKIPTRDNCAILTIDDGYKNALSNAIPVLNEFGIKPLIFVATGMIDSSSLFWFDRLDVALQATRGKIKYVSVGEYRVDVRSNNGDELSRTCKEIIYRSREAYSDDKERLAAMQALIDELYEFSGTTEDIGDDIRAVVGTLTSDELVKCVEAGAAIGSHTVNHMRLPNVSIERAIAELRDSKNDLEKRLQSECALLCYPEGECSESVANIATATGYRAAFAVSETAASSVQNIMRLQRIHLPRDASKGELLCTVGGLTSVLSGIKSRLFLMFRGQPEKQRMSTYIENDVDSLRES